MTTDKDGVRSITTDALVNAWALVGGDLYYALAGPQLLHVDLKAGRRDSVPLTGGVGRLVCALEADEQALYLATRAGEPLLKLSVQGGETSVVSKRSGCSLWLDQKTLFYGKSVKGFDRAPDASELGRVPVAGGAARVLAKDQPALSGIAADANWLYWATPGERGALFAMRTTGGPRKKLTDVSWGRVFHARGAKVYFVSRDPKYARDTACRRGPNRGHCDTVIQTMSPSDRTPTQLATHLARVEGLSATEGGVYFSSGDALWFVQQGEPKALMTLRAPNLVRASADWVCVQDYGRELRCMQLGPLR